MATRRKYRKKGKKTLTAKVNKLAKIVKVQKPELKYYEDVATVAPDYTGNIMLSPYRGIVQGTSDLQRIGDRIRTMKYHIKTRWVATAGTYTIPRQCRMIAFVYKRNPDVITTSFATIINLYLTSAYMSSVYAPLATRDWDNRTSFVTLYDKTRVLTPVDPAIGGVLRWDATFSIPKNVQLAQYNAATTGLTANELFICFLTDSAAGMACDYSSRITYTDV